MAEPGLSGMQRMLQRHTSPELFTAMARDSRHWAAECPRCRADTTNIWEMGGIRYKAAGQPRQRAHCPRCGQKGWLRIHWTGGDPTALGPRPSVLPLIFKIVLVIAIPLLLIGAIAASLIALF